MKILKIIFLVIVLLLAVFLLIGFVNDEMTYEAETKIEKPLFETFDLFNDISLLHHWIPEIVSYEIISETPDVIGSKTIFKTDDNGTKMDVEETVTEFEYGRKVGLEFSAGILYKSDVFIFEGNTENTVIKGNFKIKGTNVFANAMFFFFKGYMKSIDQRNLDNFRMFAESHKKDS